MCGILAIVNKKNCRGRDLERACSIIRHRGPDDEGFLTWVPGEESKVFAGDDTAASTKDHWKYELLPPDASFRVGFGHRRLSILDLSPAGHQPMQYKDAGLSISFNGEIYNYLEIKAELETLGHHFHSGSDTEVILHAWEEWGPECLNDFNGMFAFILLDEKKQLLYAVRDRFGVKPLYHYEGDDAIYFASEIKQIRTAPSYQFELDGEKARNFLGFGITDHWRHTFESKIERVPQGHYVLVNLAEGAAPPYKEKWYTPDHSRKVKNFDDAVGQFRHLLTDSVRLRLRSDVKVGSCLSGGLDSSSIVCIAADLLKKAGSFAGQEIVTACFDDLKFDEWRYAEEVVKRTNAHPNKVFPSFRELQEDIDQLLWHQDEPVASTSVFSQWMVFRKTHEAGLKVMIDGQGADEILAGYGGHDVAFYAGLLRGRHFSAIYKEASHYKKEHGAWPYGFLIGAMQSVYGSWAVPAKYRMKAPPAADWLLPPEPYPVKTPTYNLYEFLHTQRKVTPLPALLRYEDHNSMAWSVESRTPFMDYRLVEFCSILPERYIYNKGTRKHILRHAMHGIIPEDIENRRDKMGFVTPEELWLKGEGKQWFMNDIDKALKQFGGSLLNEERARAYVSEIIEGKRAFDPMPWRILCFYRWFNSVMK